MDAFNGVLFIIGAPTLFVVNVIGLAPFRQLSARIARLENRMADLNALTADEGGWHSFEQEQYRRLWSRSYRRSGDAALSALGDKAFCWAAATHALSLLAILAFVFWRVSAP